MRMRRLSAAGSPRGRGGRIAHAHSREQLTMGPRIGGAHRTPMDMQRPTRASPRLLLIAMASLAGCFPVPAPGDATVGRREIGADYTATAVAHWACRDMDFLVARTSRGLVLHDLDFDIVAEMPVTSAAGLVFRTSDGVTSRIYTVPADPAQPAHVRQLIAGASGTFSGLQAQPNGGMSEMNLTTGNNVHDNQQACPSAPRVRLW